MKRVGSKTCRLLAWVLLSSCGVKDGPPSDYSRNWKDIEDAIPKDEPPRKYGNPNSYEVFGERYRAEYLTSPRQVRNALVYVLQNAKRRAMEMLDLGPQVLRRDWVDPLSSAAYFDGWKKSCRRWIPPPGAELEANDSRAIQPPVVAPTTWQLTTGWKRLGAIDTGELPAAAR